MDWSAFTGEHDLSLPEWGPYSKRYFGISHRADPERGTRFDFAVVPGLYRRQLGIPDALRPSGYLPEHAGCDLEDYCYRQQLGNVDELYADIAFARLDDHSRLVECRCVNRSAAVNSFGIHFLSMLEAAGSGCRGEVVAQSDSGELTGDYSHVVGYVGIVFSEPSDGSGR